MEYGKRDPRAPLDARCLELPFAREYPCGRGDRAQRAVLRLETRLAQLAGRLAELEKLLRGSPGLADSESAAATLN